MKKLKVALVHDYLVDFGGAERVLIALHEIWPEAPVFLSVIDKKKVGAKWPVFKDWDLRTSWFNLFPFAGKLISPLRFLLPAIWKSFDFSRFNLIITSSAWAMPRLIKKGKAKHICYCHTPPRFLYGYPQARNWARYWPIKAYSALINHYLRFYDYQSAQEVDGFIANSLEVAARIKKFYRRDSTIINPPIDVFASVNKNIQKEDFYLWVGRLVSYKHPEIAIGACQKLDKKLVIIGNGPLKEKVASLIKGNNKVSYLGHVSDSRLWQFYTKAKALLSPIETEDFGMTPLEAAACGTPTIAFYSGGAKETVLEGKTGIYFHKLTVDDLVKAVIKFEKMSFSPQVAKNWANNFSKEVFQRKIKKFVLQATSA